MKPDFKKFSTNFSRGLSLASPHLINPEECQVADNFLFDGGTPYVRQGIAVYGSVNAPIVALRKFYKKNGSSYFACFAGGQLRASSVSGQFVTVSSETVVSGDVGFTIYDDFLYFTNISTAPKYFDGSSIDNVGLSSPIFRKQITDFEAPEIWNVVGSGVVEADYNYPHIDLGTQALKIWTNYAGGAGFSLSGTRRVNFECFATNVSSDVDDLLQIFVTPHAKTNISTFWINFYDRTTADGLAQWVIGNTSAWISSSSDECGMTHSIPKRLLAVTSGTSGYIWTSNWVQIALAGKDDMANPAIISLDNLRMIKTPPILTSISTTGRSGGAFYGSSQSRGSGSRAPDIEDTGMGVWRYTQDYGSVDTYKAEVNRGLQTTGLKVTSAPLPAEPSTDYFYKATFCKKGPGGIEIESNPTFQTSAITISTNGSTWQYIKLTNIPIAPSSWGVVGRKIYRRPRTVADMQFVNMVSDNQVTTFLDNVPYNALGNVLEEDHWPPPLAKYILSASNQMTYYFNVSDEGVTHPSRVRWSKAYEPYYVPLENSMDIAPNDGTEGTGIFEFMNLTHFMKERSTWVIDENNVLRNIHQSIGNVADKSIAVGKNEVFWLSEEGIIMYNLRFRNISKGEPGDANKNRIDAIIHRLPTAYIKNAAGIYYNGFYLLSVTDVGSTTNNLVICYDSINDCFSTFPNLNVNCWTTWQGYKDGYRLFFGNNSGLICEFLTGNYDVSTSISSRIRTKEFGVTIPQNSYRKAWLHTENLDGNLRTVNVKPYYDFNNLSADNQSIVVSGTYALTKIDLPQKDGASFCSLEFSSSGRYRINQVDLLGKEEEVR
jgi:hypothetical protein